MSKLTVVTNIVPAYRYPVFRMVRELPDTKLNILVTAALSSSCGDAVENLSVKQSFSVSISRKTRHAAAGTTQTEPLPIPIGLVGDIAANRPDVVLSGDMGIQTLLCWIACRLIGAKLAVSVEDIETSAAGRSALQKRLRRFLARRVDAFLAWGVPARSYLASLGVPPQRIFTATQAVDNEYWSSSARATDRMAARNRLGLSGTAFLLVGRALPLKGFHHFLEAWSRIPQGARRGASVTIVGDGAYLPTLREIARAHDLNDVNFAGAQPPSVLAEYYAAADVFVFPSLVDVWGLVVNEAVAAGLPVMASKFAGATQGLIAGTPLGVIVDPTDIDRFSQAIAAWVDSPPARTTDEATRALSSHTFAESAAAIQALLAFLARVK